MQDKIFATISMFTVVAFMGFVAIRVMEVDLWIVTVLVLSIGIWDFWRQFRDAAREGAGNGNGKGKGS